MPDTLTRLKKWLDQKPHDFRPIIQTYPDLDVEKYVDDSEIVKRGRERGEDAVPASSETGFDAVESEIIEFISSRRKDGHEELETQLTTLRQRLGDLDFLSRFSEIRDISISGLADLKAEYQSGLDDLHEARRDLKESEDHRKAYRETHRITRPTKIQTRLTYTIKILVLLLLVAAELVANGYFLSGGAEFGLVGGVLEALIFSVLNVGVAVLISVYALPFLFHTSFFRKLWGLIWLLFFVPWTLTLNLGIAHYRELGASGAEEFSNLVVRHIQTNPLGLVEFESWVLFCIGVMFSVIALIDAFGIRDPFPQLQSIEDELRKRRATYSEARKAAIEQISEIRSEYQEAITQIRAELGKLKQEQVAILSHKDRLVALFDTYENQLENAANAILTRYREANKKARSNAGPKHFNRKFKLEKVKIGKVDDGAWQIPELDDNVRKAQQDLEDVVKALAEKYDDALASYRELDIIVPGT